MTFIKESTPCKAMMQCSHNLIIHQVRQRKVYSLVYVQIEKIYQSLKTVFDQLSKHLKLCQKYSAVHCIFNSLLGVWISWWNTVSCVWYITSHFCFFWVSDLFFVMFRLKVYQIVWSFPGLEDNSFHSFPKITSNITSQHCLFLIIKITIT